jgi:hypothetical protein
LLIMYTSNAQVSVTGALWNLAADSHLHAMLFRSYPVSVDSSESSNDVTGFPAVAHASGSVLDAVLATMDAQAMSAAVQENGCGFLWSLLTSDEAKHISFATTSSSGSASVLALACLRRVMRAMKLHMTSVATLQTACAALCNIFALPVFHDVTGTLSSVSPSASSRSSCTSGNALTTMDPAATALALGCVVAISNAMDAHPVNAAVQEHACLALWSLLSSPTGTTAVRARAQAPTTDGIMSLLTRARERFPKHESIRVAAEGAIMALLTQATV